MKIHLILLLILLFLGTKLHSQSKIPNQKKLQVSFDIGYTNPFPKDNSFERIGSILGISGGFTYELVEKSFIGFDFSSALFFPNGGGGDFSRPKIIPQGRFKFSNTENLWTEIAVGALYNPSLGIEINASYSLNQISSSKNIFSFYINGVTQTFGIKDGEIRTQAPMSWLTTVGIKHIKPFSKDLALIIKPGIGIRGDSDTNTKFVLNGAIIIAWKYFSLVTTYTNKTPQREFPAFIVSSIGFDVAKFINEIKPKKKIIPHESLLEY